MIKKIINAESTSQVLEILATEGDQARIIAGGTDLIIEMERGMRPGLATLVDISRVPALDRITEDDQGWIHLGPLVTHSHCVASALIVEKALPLAQAAVEVGAPQIRNRGTVAGNLITASPANDTIGPLLALGAEVSLESLRRGARRVRLADFYTGVRQTVMAADEMLTGIHFPAMPENQRGMFIKLGLRRAQAISVVYVTVLLRMSGDLVDQASITLGSVSPTIMHATEAEASLIGSNLPADRIGQAALLAAEAASPIDDVRSSARYRREMVRVCTRRALWALKYGRERAGFPQNPVLLWGARYDGAVVPPKSNHYGGSNFPIETT
ncbi:MAG: FAD binding domain-containing protein, partial [Anaerolineales bacterium]|nr:FAD binding domain-containing protein [Anaerolineales bacterium]